MNSLNHSNVMLGDDEEVVINLYQQKKNSIGNSSLTKPLNSNRSSNSSSESSLISIFSACFCCFNKQNINNSLGEFQRVKTVENEKNYSDEAAL